MVTAAQDRHQDPRDHRHQHPRGHRHQNPRSHRHLIQGKGKQRRQHLRGRHLIRVARLRREIERARQLGKPLTLWPMGRRGQRGSKGGRVQMTF